MEGEREGSFHQLLAFKEGDQGARQDFCDFLHRNVKQLSDTWEESYWEENGF